MSQPFFVRHEDDLPKLREWLGHIAFNVAYPLGSDRKGNPMVGLSLDTAPDARARDKRGLIVVVKHSLLDEVAQTADRMKRP